jgi:hypothetical protein
MKVDNWESFVMMMIIEHVRSDEESLTLRGKKETIKRASDIKRSKDAWHMTNTLRTRMSHGERFRRK